jgi:hypothetical protein
MTPKPLYLLAALSLVGTSGAAIAQTAAPLSLASAPGLARAAPADASELHGTARWVVGAIALGLIVWGIIELTDNDDGAFPVSP